MIYLYLFYYRIKSKRKHFAFVLRLGENRLGGTCKIVLNTDKRGQHYLCLFEKVGS